MKQTHYGTFLTSRYVELPYLDFLYVTLMIHMCFLIIWKKRKPKIITNKYYRVFFLMKKLMLHRKTDDRPQNDHCILSLFFFAETRKLDTTKHNCSTSYRYFDANVMSLDFPPIYFDLWMFTFLTAHLFSREKCRGCGDPEHTVTDAFGKVEVFAEGGLERRAALVGIPIITILYYTFNTIKDLEYMNILS